MLKTVARRLLPGRVWSWLRRARDRWTALTFRRRIVPHVYGGHALRVAIADPLGRGWYDHDWDALPEVELLARGRLKPGARVFDLGAHQCVVALVLSRVVGPLGRVLALEADAHDARIGRVNRDLNEAANLDIVHAAAAKESGEIRFEHGNVAAGAGPRVAAFSVDDLAARYGPPDVLFIDVEGFELEVLRGARHTLSGVGPDVFVEVHTPFLPRYGGSVEEVLAFFPAGRYERWLASESDPQFRPFADAVHLLRDRFFMVALASR